MAKIPRQIQKKEGQTETVITNMVIEANLEAMTDTIMIIIGITIANSEIVINETMETIIVQENHKRQTYQVLLHKMV